MKKIFLALILAIFLTANCALVENTNVTLTSTSQALTASWADLGSEISIRGFTRMAIWLNVDINSTNNLRVRVLYKIASGGTQYNAQILTPSASDVKLENEYYEFNVDADGNYVFDVGLIGANYCQVQVIAGTLGSPAGKILAAYATLSNK
jgi:hypothetical protein